MNIVAPQKLPDEFLSLLDLLPVPFCVWQLLDPSNFEGLVCLEMNVHSKNAFHIPKDKSLFNVPHSEIIPFAPQPVRDGKMKVCVTGEPFNFVIHYADGVIDGIYEVNMFRANQHQRITCEFFCEKDVPVKLEEFKTVQFCRGAMNMILHQTTTDNVFLNVMIANILAHIENYSKNSLPERTTIDNFDVMDCNTMIRRLALVDEQNNDYIDVFLRSFPFVGLDAEYILHRLILRYIAAGSENYFLINESASNSPEQCRNIIQLRVINVLKRWLTRYPYYFTKNKNLVMILEAFIRYTKLIESSIGESSRNNDSWRASLLSSIEEIFKQRRVTVDTDPLSTSPAFNKGATSHRTSIMTSSSTSFPLSSSFHSLITSKNQKPEAFAKTLAKHLTCKALSLFKSIELLELHAKLHSKAGSDTSLECPNVTALIENSNFVSKWVATEVCRENDFLKRAELIQVFVETAYAALCWHDFETCFSISAGLCVHPVDRLTTTWTKVFREKNSFQKMFRRSSGKIKLSGTERKWQEILKVVNVQKNYNEYRTRLSDLLKAATTHQGIKPGIPAYQVICRDLLFLDENVNKKKSESENISPVVPQMDVPDANHYLSDFFSMVSEEKGDSGSFDSSGSESTSSSSLETYRDNNSSSSFDYSNPQIILEMLAEFQKTDSINYFKLNQIASALNYVEHFKISIYDFSLDASIKQYFLQVNVADEDELYELSYKIQPPNSPIG